MMNQEELIYRIKQKIYENQGIYKDYPQAVDGLYHRLIRDLEELLK